MTNKVSKYTNYSMEDLEKEQDKIQTNITDIFIRYFTKLEDVSTGFDFSVIPLDFDASLHISIKDNFESRSVAFNELFELSRKYKLQRNIKR